MSAMRSQYGPEKAKRVFYASRNAGKIKGVDPESRAEGGPVDPGGRRTRKDFPEMSGGRGGGYSGGRNVLPEHASPETAPREPVEQEHLRIMQQMPRRKPPEGPAVPQSELDAALKRLQEHLKKEGNGKARGGRVDAHEAREKELIGELAHMNRHRARGGPAAEGAYMVGERGPEMFVPDRSGTIIPHHELTRLARKYGGGRVSHMRRR
jgi:hypothetical protein